MMNTTLFTLKLYYILLEEDKGDGERDSDCDGDGDPQMQ